jgi:hypothetical protein
VVGSPGLEQLVLGDRAGGDDASHLALDQALGQGRVFHLVADGDAVSRMEQFSQVMLDRLDRHAGHRDRAVASGEGEAEDAGDEFGVFFKRLEEVAHAEQQDHPRVPGLGLPVLLHHRGHGGGQ